MLKRRKETKKRRPKGQGLPKRESITEWHNKCSEYWACHDAYTETTHKKCTCCKLLKISNEFSKSMTDKDGLQAWCNECFKTRHIENPKRQMLANAKSHAKRKGYEFSIMADDVHIPEKCPMLGIVLTSGKVKNESPSIDRIDSSIGYIPDNIHVISWRANNLKKDATLEELEILLAYLKDIKNPSKK